MSNKRMPTTQCVFETGQRTAQVLHDNTINEGVKENLDEHRSNIWTHTNDKRTLPELALLGPYMAI